MPLALSVIEGPRPCFLLDSGIVFFIEKETRSLACRKAGKNKKQSYVSNRAYNITPPNMLLSETVKPI